MTSPDPLPAPVAPCTWIVTTDGNTFLATDAASQTCADALSLSSDAATIKPAAKPLTSAMPSAATTTCHTGKRLAERWSSGSGGLDMWRLRFDGDPNSTVKRYRAP